MWKRKDRILEMQNKTKKTTKKNVFLDFDEKVFWLRMSITKSIPGAIKVNERSLGVG
jgi:DNA relaxase NicK